jgi:hypothetical protein
MGPLQNTGMRTTRTIMQPALYHDAAAVDSSKRALRRTDTPPAYQFIKLLSYQTHARDTQAS